MNNTEDDVERLIRNLSESMRRLNRVQAAVDYWKVKNLKEGFPASVANMMLERMSQDILDMMYDGRHIDDKWTSQKMLVEADVK